METNDGASILGILANHVSFTEQEVEYKHETCLAKPCVILRLGVIFRHNNEKTFLIWINEEDHCRVISMNKDSNMKQTFERFCRGLKEVRADTSSLGNLRENKVLLLFLLLGRKFNALIFGCEL